MWKYEICSLSVQFQYFTAWTRKKYEKFEISMFISNIDNNVHRNNSFTICFIIIFVIMLLIMIHHIFSFVEIPYCVNEQFQPTESFCYITLNVVLMHSSMRSIFVCNSFKVLSDLERQVYFTSNEGDVFISCLIEIGGIL